MKKHHLKPALLIVILFCSLFSVAQTKVFEFYYDASGNRQERYLIELKSAAAEGMTEQSEQQELFEDMLEGYEIKIYPNPTKGKLTVSINGPGNKLVRTMVFNIQGKFITGDEFVGPENSVDLTAQPAGIYIMRIIVGENSKDWKIVKE